MHTSNISEQLAAANMELAFVQTQNRKLIAKLVSANKELAFLNEEKAKRWHELKAVNKELAFQHKEKEKRAAELTIASNQLLVEAAEKEKIAAAFVISEDELKKIESQFKLLVGNVKDYAIFMLDTHGRVATWNSGAHYMKGYGKEEIIGKPVDVFYTQEAIDRGEPKRNLQLALKYGHFETEGPRVRKDGSLFYANVVLTSILDKTGKLYGYTKIIKDISDIKIAEQKMQRLASRLLLATESMQLGIWDWDITNDILSWDDYMYRIYNTDQAQFNSLYNEWISRVHQEDKQRVDNDIKLALEGKKDYRPEFRIVWKDASVHYIKASGIVERDGTGNAIRMIGANWDITERKVAEKMKDKISAEIIQRNTDLQQFSYIVSHNLRAPIANILGLTAIINDPSNGTEVNNKMILALASSAKQLDDIIRDLNYILQVKRDMTGKPKWVQFSLIVANIKQSISNIIKNEYVEIKIDFSAVDTILTLNGYLYSIFFTLITNSIKYRQPGKNPAIEITSLRLGGKIILIFKDNGLGIDLEKSGKQVFGLYKRFHTNADGKGMGLYMVKTQVEMLGGKIYIQSEINKGTEFRIEFGEDDLTI